VYSENSLGDLFSEDAFMAWLQPCPEVPALATPSNEACISAVSRVLEHSWRMVGATAATGAAIAKSSRADSQLKVEHIKQRCIICMHAEASKVGNIALVTSRVKKHNLYFSVACLIFCL
jgi:hypothetical protein